MILLDNGLMGQTHILKIGLTECENILPMRGFTLLFHLKPPTAKTLPVFLFLIFSML